MNQEGKKRFSFLKKIIIALIAIILLAGGYSGYRIYTAIYQAQVILKEKETAYFYIHTDWKFDDVINHLYENNYITNRSVFEWLAERKNYKTHVLPGRYLLKKKMSYNEIVNLLRSGKQNPIDVKTDLIHTKEQLAGRVGKLLEADSLKISDLLKDNNYLGKYGFTSRNVISMFIANTYQFYWNTSVELFFEKMNKEYQKFWSSERLKKAEETGFSKIEIITIASIVEMESKKKDERPIVAGVYINRLRKDMFLQADPTIIFAVKDFTIKRVLRKHLEIDSPYNTYKNKGLPPGPICLPSKASIDAVLNYDKNKYIYFCAKDDFSGYHNFAESYAQHAVNAKKYHEALNRNKIN